jgi:hypothetical protein
LLKITFHKNIGIIFELIPAEQKQNLLNKKGFKNEKDF